MARNIQTEPITGFHKCDKDGKETTGHGKQPILTIPPYYFARTGLRTTSNTIKSFLALHLTLIDTAITLHDNDSVK